MMEFPVIPFKLCDFCSIQNEHITGDVLTVTGTLPCGNSAVTTFKKTSPKGNWLASTLEGRK